MCSFFILWLCKRERSHAGSFSFSMLYFVCFPMFFTLVSKLINCLAHLLPAIVCSFSSEQWNFLLSCPSQMFPGTPGDPSEPTVFLSCSADNTVRLWQADDGRTAQRVATGAVSLTWKPPHRIVALNWWRLRTLYDKVTTQLSPWNCSPSKEWNC